MGNRAAPDCVRLACIVLAAGASSRMGVPKALLRRDGESALARLVRLARGAGCEVVVVLGRHADVVRPEAEGARVVVNPRPEAGRTGSLQAGLAAAAGAGAALVWPVDHPAVAEATVRALAASAARDRIVIPRHAGRGGHPIVLGADVWPEVLALAPDAPLRNVVRRAAGRVVDVPVDDPGVLLNLDTPEDAARAGWEPPPPG